MNLCGEIPSPFRRQIPLPLISKLLFYWTFLGFRWNCIIFLVLFFFFSWKRFHFQNERFGLFSFILKLLFLKFRGEKLKQQNGERWSKARGRNKNATVTFVNIQWNGEIHKNRPNFDESLGNAIKITVWCVWQQRTRLFRFFIIIFFEFRFEIERTNKTSMKFSPEFHVRMGTIMHLQSAANRVALLLANHCCCCIQIIPARWISIPSGISISNFSWSISRLPIDPTSNWWLL